MSATGALGAVVGAFMAIFRSKVDENATLSPEERRRDGRNVPASRVWTWLAGLAGGPLRRRINFKWEQALILHAATWCHRAIAGKAIGSPVAAMRTLPPANSGDAFLEQDRCKIPPIGFAIYHPRLSGDDRPATDWQFAEQARRIGMSTKEHYEGYVVAMSFVAL